MHQTGCRALRRVLCAVLLLALCAGCGRTAEYTPVNSASPMLRTAVLYDGQTADGQWQDTYGYLTQSTLLGLEPQAVDVSAGLDLAGVDVVYPDPSLLQSAAWDKTRDAIVSFAENGGSVFLENAFYQGFDPAFIGAKEFVPLEKYPDALEFPKVGADLEPLQTLVRDYSGLFPEYADFERLSALDYGVAVKPDKAEALVRQDKLALYTLNRYGKGLVFFTNPLLPGRYSIGGFEMVSRSVTQQSLANTTASANQLLVNDFAAYAAKQKYGFSVSRVFGCYGAPSLSWELHFEEITGFANGGGSQFAEYCTAYGQIPSYMIVRDTYWWFHRIESVTYLTGQPDADGSVRYEHDRVEGAYSAGTHIAADGKWLSQFEKPDGGSYFVDYPEYDMRAYPDAGDWNGDGAVDLLTGSVDGQFRYYEGVANSERFSTKAAVTLTDENGQALSVPGGYSAPVLIDLDGDGVTDLLSGCLDGKLYWFQGQGGLSFTPQGVWRETGLTTQSLPAVGDLTGDGTADLLVGSNESKLLLYPGLDGEKQDKSAWLAGIDGTWCAPCVADWNGDGANDLAVGTFDGYVARIVSKNGALAPDGFFTTRDQNYKGNANIKFGNNCVPRFADWNGDGAADLIAGSLEYGLAYPIDSPYFPYREELQSEIDFMKENNFYVGMHFLTGAYASAEREKEEIALHKQALASYGLDLTGTGTNQHTWHLSKLDEKQSMRGMWDAGLLWNSGFEPSGANYAPQNAAENVIALPFFMTENGERTLLVQNCATLLYMSDEWAALSAKYEMPVCAYYHADFAYQNEETARKYIEWVERFRDANPYNFVREDQMMHATAAAYHAELSAETGGADDTPAITLTVSVPQGDYPLYDERYAAATGLRVDFSADYCQVAEVTTDAAVWRTSGNSLYVSADRPVQIWTGKKPSVGAHLERVNIPADIEATETGAALTFRDGGMMQVVVSGGAETDSPGWQTEETADGKTIFTKFGGADTLAIVYQ